MSALRVFTVHRQDAAEPVLVREGFSWPALFFGWVWLLAHGALLAALVLLAAWILVAQIASPSLRLPVIVGLVLAQGVFGLDLWRLSLGWRGWRQDGVVAALDTASARLRLADASLAPPDLRPDLRPGG